MELREWNTKRTDQFILETCAIQVSGELPGSAEPIVVITIFETSGVRTFLAVFLIGHLGNNGSSYLFKNPMKNTLKSGLVTGKGGFNISRNPMYVGLLFLYIGIAIIKGNWWTFILIPVVIFVVTRFVIIKEESYLERAFGEAYLNYKMKVGRWL